MPRTVQLSKSDGVYASVKCINTEMATNEGWGGIAEVAAHLQVTKDSICRWVASKGLPARRMGRLFRFRLSEVDEWVKHSGGDDSENSPSGMIPDNETSKNG